MNWLYTVLLVLPSWLLAGGFALELRKRPTQSEFDLLSENFDSLTFYANVIERRCKAFEDAEKSKCLSASKMEVEAELEVSEDDADRSEEALLEIARKLQ